MTILAKYQLLMLQGYALFFFYQVFNQYHILASCLKSKVCCGKHGKQPPWNNIPTGRVRAWEVTIGYCFYGTTLLEVNKSFLLIYYNFFAKGVLYFPI